MIAKITKADKNNIYANTKAIINLTQHSIFREIEVEFNGRHGDTSQLYPYRSILESLFNRRKEVQETCRLSEGWTRVISGHMNVIAVGGNNDGLNVLAAIFARSTLVELINRSHLDFFHQKRLIPTNIDFHKKLIPSPNDFVCRSAAPVANAQEENFKLVIQSCNFIIQTMKRTSTAHKALMDFFLTQNMVHHLLRVEI